MARKRKSDAKEAALAETRTLNPRPEAVRDEQFVSSEFLDARDLVQVKYEMVRRVRVDGAPVARAAAAFGFSRPSFYEAAAAVDRDGLGGLVPAKPGPRRAHKLTDEVIYEQLRRRALCGDADGWRLGLGVLQHRGVAGWLRVRSASTPVRSAPARPMPCVARGVDAELVELLTSMALTVAAAGVSGHE